jgi:hypothetical protein
MVVKDKERVARCVDEINSNSPHLASSIVKRYLSGKKRTGRR